VKIAVKLAFDEQGALRLLNWLASENAVILRARPDLPLLYDSGVVYQREEDETWSDVLNLLAEGHEDCDALSAARAGELIARGYKALAPGDEGYELAAKLKPASIPAEVMLRTRTRPDRPGLYHCIVRYPIGKSWFRDDPSAKLGMYGSIAPSVWKRRLAAGGPRGKAGPESPSVLEPNRRRSS
jgi:hypothetical protein